MSNSLEYTNQNSLTRYPFKDNADLTWTASTVASGELPNTIFTDARIEVSTVGVNLASVGYVYNTSALLDTWTFHFGLFDLPITATSLTSQVFIPTGYPVRIEIDVAALSVYFRATFSASDTLTLSNPTTIVFCPSACTLITPIVTSVTLNNTLSDGTTETETIIKPDVDPTIGLTFTEGTNLQLTAANGGMTMDVIAGAGQGLHGACQSLAGIVYTINNITGNAFNNFGLTGDPCISIQQAATPATIYAGGSLLMEANDSTYHNVTLTTSTSITSITVEQTATSSDSTAISSLTILSTDGNYYVVSLVIAFGVYSLAATQSSSAPTTPYYSGLTLQSTNELYYSVTLGTTSGTTALVVGQTPCGPGWTVAGLQLSTLCTPPCTTDEVTAFAYYLNRVKAAILSLADYITQVKANYDLLCVNYAQQVNDSTQIQPAYLQAENVTFSNRKNDYHRLCCGIYSPTDNELPITVSVTTDELFSLVPSTSYVTQDGVKQVLPDTYGFANRVVKCNSVLYYGFVLSDVQAISGTSLQNHGESKYDIIFNLTAPQTNSYYSLPLLQAAPNYTIGCTCINRQGTRDINLTIDLLYQQNVSLATSLIFTTPTAFTLTSGQLVTNKTVITPVTSSGFRNVVVNFGQKATCTVGFTCIPATDTLYYDFSLNLSTPLGFANKTVRIYM